MSSASAHHRSNSSASTSTGAGSSSSTFEYDHLYEPDSPETPPEPRDGGWSEVGPSRKKLQRERKAREVAAAAKAEGGNAPAAAPYSAYDPSTWNVASKQKQQPARLSKAKVGGKAPAPMPEALTIPETVSTKGEGTKKAKKGSKELSKTELQARCVALLTNSSKHGFMGVAELGEVLAAALGFTSWNRKYKQVHGPLKAFLDKTDGLTVTAVNGEERVYLEAALDAARTASEGKATRGTGKRGGRGGIGGERSACRKVLTSVPRMLLAASALRFAACAMGVPALGCGGTAGPSSLAPTWQLGGGGGGGVGGWLGGSVGGGQCAAGIEPAACLLSVLQAGLQAGSTSELREWCTGAWAPRLAQLLSATPLAASIVSGVPTCGGGSSTTPPDLKSWPSHLLSSAAPSDVLLWAAALQTLTALLCLRRRWSRVAGITAMLLPSALTYAMAEAGMAVPLYLPLQATLGLMTLTSASL